MIANKGYWFGGTLIFAIWLAIMFGISQAGSTAPNNVGDGLTVVIDSKTRCEYLTHRGGSLTPRLDVSGKQICTP